MSKNVDERVVQMQFNNREFESGVQKTLGTLERLKKGLDLNKAADGLSGLGAASHKLSSSGLASLGHGVETIASKFSMLGIMGVTALANITNSAVNAGKTLVKSLTVEPISDGFREYEKKVNSIATILTNTAKAGTTIDDVTKALAELNDYSDRTIYNFGNMADSIGKFTSKGVALKPAVASIKGIANLGAATGASAEQVNSAMYQLSQAIGTGLKSIDYISVENAGLSGTIFEDRLKAKAKQLGTWTKATEQAFAKGESFRNTLSKGWVTAKVLQEVLADLGNDEALTKKAGEVRTFTSLLNTAKESVASGWSETWEIIIGNKDEATKFFTSLNDAFSKLIGPSTEARNEMLKFWKANEGRNMLIDSFRQIANTLDWFITVIKYQWSQLFPKKTGADLYWMTVNFNKLVKSLSPTIQGLYYFGKIVKGVFSIISIGKQFIVALAKNIVYLFDKLKPARDQITVFLAKVGDWLEALDLTLKKTDAFNKTFKKIADFLAELINGIVDCFIEFIDSLDLFNTADTSGVEKLSTEVQEEFKPLEKIGMFFTNAMNTMKALWPKIKTFMSNAWKIIGEGFNQLAIFVGKVGAKIGPALKTLSKEDIMKIFEGGLLSAILIGVLKLVKIVEGFAGSAGKFVKSVTSVFDQVRNSLKAYQTDIKANVIKKIATAVAILAASIFILSIIKTEKLAGGLGAVTILIGELVGAMALFNKIANGEDFKAVKKIATALLILSVAILLLTFAIRSLGKMEPEKLALGLGAVAVALLSFAGFLKLGNFEGESFIKQAASLLLLSIAVLALGFAVNKFGTMNPDVLVQGMFAIGFALAGFAGLTHLIAKENNMLQAAISMLAIAFAMGKVIDAVQRLGELKPKVMEQGIVGLGFSLAIISTALKFFPEDMLKSGAGFAALAGGVIILANAIKMMGEMETIKLTQGLVGLVVVMGLVVTVMYALSQMKGLLPAAFSIAIISASMIGFAIALGMLSLIPIEGLAKGLMAMAVVLGIIGLAAMAFQPFLAAMALMGGALIVVGLGLAALGGGAFLLSLGISALALAIVPAVPAIALLLGTLTLMVLLIPGVIVMTAAILGLSGSIIVLGAALIVLGAGALVGGIGALVGGVGFLMLAAGLMALSQVDYEKLKSISDYAGDMLAASVKLLLAAPGLIAGGKALWDFGNGAIQTGNGLAYISDIVKGLIESLKTVPSEIVAIGKQIIVAVMWIIAQVVLVLMSSKGVVNEVVKSIVEESADAISSKDYLFYNSGVNLVEGFVRGIRSRIEMAADAASYMAKSALRAANQSLEINSPSGAFEDVGKFANLGLAKGLKKYATLAESAATSVGQRTLQPVMSMAGASASGNGFRSVGNSSMVSSIAQGLQNGSPMLRTLDNLSSMNTNSGQQLDLNGILTIQVTNDKGEIIGIAQKAIKDLLRKESR